MNVKYLTLCYGAGNTRWQSGELQAIRDTGTEFKASDSWNIEIQSIASDHTWEAWIYERKCTVLQQQVKWFLQFYNCPWTWQGPQSFNCCLNQFIPEIHFQAMFTVWLPFNHRTNVVRKFTRSSVTLLWDIYHLGGWWQSHGSKCAPASHSYLENRLWCGREIFYLRRWNVKMQWRDWL